MSYTWDQEIIHKGGNPNLLANYTAQEICRTEPILTLAANPENIIHKNKEMNNSIHLQILALFISTPYPKKWRTALQHDWMLTWLTEWVLVITECNSHRLRNRYLEFQLNLRILWSFYLLSTGFGHSKREWRGKRQASSQIMKGISEGYIWIGTRTS